MVSAKCQPRKDHPTALSIGQVLNGTDLRKYAHTYARYVLTYRQLCSLLGCLFMRAHMCTYLLLSSEAVAPKDPPHLLLFLLLWVAFHHVCQGRLVQWEMVFQVLWNDDIRDTLSILRTCTYVRTTHPRTTAHIQSTFTQHRKDSSFALFTTLTLR